MKIAIKCPHCAQPYSIMAQAIGKQFQCQRCKNNFVASAPNASPPLNDLGSLFDEVTESDAKRSQVTPGNLPAAPTNDNSLLNSYIPQSLPVAKQPKLLTRRNALAMPWFVMCFVIVAFTSIALVVAIFTRGAGIVDRLSGGNSSEVGWMFYVIVAFIGFSLATACYWAGESIRLGRLCTFSDIFSSDD